MIRSTDNRLLYWNKEAFQEVGPRPREAPRHLGRAAAVRHPPHQARAPAPGASTASASTPSYGQAHYHIFAWQNGGVFQSPDGKKATLPGGKNQEALQWMADLMKDLGGWQTHRGLPHEPRRLLGHQRPGALPGQPAGHGLPDQQRYPHRIARFRPDMKFGFAQPPLKKAGDKPLTWSGGHSYCISTGAKERTSPGSSCKWLISEEGLTVLYDGDLGRAKATGGAYVPRMSGQPELDKKMYAKYKTGIPTWTRCRTSPWP